MDTERLGLSSHCSHALSDMDEGSGGDSCGRDSNSSLGLGPASAGEGRGSRQPSRRGTGLAPRTGRLSKRWGHPRRGPPSLWHVAAALVLLCLCQGAWALGLGSVALKAKAKAKARGGAKGRISLYRLTNNRHNATCLDGG